MDWLFIVIAFAAGGGAGDVQDPGLQAEAVPSKLQAEEQVPTGKFTTATEVKPILDATKANWVAVREFEGQDLLYVTHLLSWRCGLVQMRFAINGGELKEWPLPPCLLDTATPNAIRTEDGLPFAAFELGSIKTVSIEVTYDDLSIDSATFERSEIIMP